MIALLMDSLKGLLQERLADVRLPAVNQTVRAAPVVYLGCLPPPSLDAGPAAEAYPFVLLRWSAGQDEEGASLETVRIEVGVYGANAQAGQDVQEVQAYVLNLLARVRLVLRETRRIDGWELTLPMDSLLDEEAACPFGRASIVTTWRTPAPEQPQEEDFYGQDYGQDQQEQG
ncbi:hypothetical protein [Desulfocurvibacter africanus]|uniref:DUF3168 domain-containing protein n=1 Tax=Desulfocurvibacter africanus subsp. africanus str. Walvis Bay TaxID=690850 RepID=F3YY73_DESAF|nr:hypothetical protein [Desulfocurvibacter africanus]EGJ51849.1 hypothetical protein Desaf_3569 [Desulfocurvibacter africanus subsp. africanus str. Walvis Bay]